MNTEVFLAIISLFQIFSKEKQQPKICPCLQARKMEQENCYLGMNSDRFIVIIIYHGSGKVAYVHLCLLGIYVMVHFKEEGGLGNSLGKKTCNPFHPKRFPIDE